MGRLDGRALDVNFWVLEAGMGVNLNVPRMSADGCSWSINRVEDGSRITPRAPDLEIVKKREGGTTKDDRDVSRNWGHYKTAAEGRSARLPTAFELRASPLLHAEGFPSKCWIPVEFTGAEGADPRLRISGMSGARGMPVEGGAAWMRVERLSCGRLSMRYIRPQVPSGSQAPTVFIVACSSDAPTVCPPEAPECTTPIADVPDGAAFYIPPAASEGFCLMAGYDEKSPDIVKLAKITGDAKQKWTLVDGDGFRNEASGEYLDSDVAYAFVCHLSEIWHDNHTDLRTAPRSRTGTQKWVMGPEEFHGGKVLRHWMDGRGVDVHGWKIEEDGGNMGVENSVHGDCKGISYVLRLCDEYQPASAKNVDCCTEE